MAVYYDTAGKYLQSCTTLEAKIIALDNVIAVLEAQLLTPASSGNDNISEYQLNDGQTIIREVYRGTKGITAALESMEMLKQKYVNRLNGRVHRLVDSKNFRRHGIW